ncbi:MAG: PHP domain-containing protein [Micrococcales bacterium]|nr:PHP domain-containing protein [Micrococcales bacterium]
MLIDLHTHSTVSDGTDSPEQVMAAAASAGLDVVALTDHDSTAGWDGAVRSALAHGLTLIRGLELSAKWQGIAVHLLSYLNHPAYPPLVDQLDKIRLGRIERAKTMVDLVAKDYPVSWPDVVAQCGPGAVVGRPHIADALVAAGLMPDRTTVFEQVLHNSGRYYVPHYAPEATEAIQLIIQAGGVPVLAHPGAIKRQKIVPDEAIKEMADAGLFGLEVRHRDNPAPQQRRLQGLATKLGLAVTGASDYHGTGKPNRLGENSTSSAVLAQIIERGQLDPI